LLALEATLLLALLAANTRAPSRHVALRKDNLATREASLTDCDAGGSDLAFLNSSRSSS